MAENQLRTILIRTCLFILFIASIILVWMSCLRQYLTLPTIQGNALQLHEYVQHHYGVSVFCYIGIYIGIAVAALPLAALATVVSGYVYGTFLGAFYTVIGATIGGTLSFLMVRYAIGVYVQQRFAQRLAHFNQLLARQGWFFLLTVHFVPFIPFAVVNVLAGLTTISVITFIWTTAAGVLPSALIFACSGKQFSTIHRLQDIFSLRIIGLFCLLVGFTVTAVIISKLFRRRK